MTPKRIQRQRTKGWRMPEGAIYVGRPSVWGNPYRAGVTHLLGVVEPFRRALTNAIERPWGPDPVDIEFRVMAERLAPLSGHDLACWCPLDQPCHADVLLELANVERQSHRTGVKP